MNTRPAVKMPVEKVIELKKLRSEGKTLGQIALRFGISTAYAWRIIKGINRVL